MKKKEAILAMLDGKKIRHSSEPRNHYIYLTDCYSQVRNQRKEKEVFEISLAYNQGWEIYEEPKDKKIEKVPEGALWDVRAKINELIDAVNLLNKEREDV